MMDKLPITEHLGELRKRLMLSLGAVVIVAGVCFYFSEDIFSMLTLPMNSSLKLSAGFPFFSFEPLATRHELVFLAPAEALWMHIKVSLISGLVISSPLLLYEFWAFVAPGLMPKEKKYVVPFIAATTFLFLLGALFCFIIVLPFAMNFLLNYKTGVLKPMLSVGKYIDFCLKFILAFGAIFELPVVLVFLTRMGIVTPESLGKNRKYAIVLAFVAAALITPTPDAFNQTLMALPIILLYEAGILASKVLRVKQKDVENDKTSPPA
ncbi:MAG TPA: twin-arginine translocase subunit TatC [Nitrospirae bacterium]|nr:twin-arginine translocase subunit TatC [Nitrospirota bacterium]HDK16895.1 twin-arginine translocase subunit TatC [Nitrospirota bacterium]HDK82636.1 twin-arginine translocase subunit TatC [Nitrospirota bacterium]HDO25462.1 twin-arginine translocase subunit TatC [Nitrospirota bacterium]